MYNLFTKTLLLGTDWDLYTGNGLWNICKSLVSKILYNVLSILQVVIFCRQQIIGQSTLILLLDLFGSIITLLMKTLFYSMIFDIIISTGIKYHTQ